MRDDANWSSRVSTYYQERAQMRTDGQFTSAKVVFLVLGNGSRCGRQQVVQLRARQWVCERMERGGGGGGAGMGGA